MRNPLQRPTRATRLPSRPEPRQIDRIRPVTPHTHKKLQNCKAATLLNDPRTSAALHREKLPEKLPRPLADRRNWLGDFSDDCERPERYRTRPSARDLPMAKSSFPVPSGLVQARLGPFSMERSALRVWNHRTRRRLPRPVITVIGADAEVGGGQRQGGTRTAGLDPVASRGKDFPCRQWSGRRRHSLA
jgi:hypothetical protein